MEVLEITVMSMIASSSMGVGEKNPGGDPSANDRRGGWGNLWE